MLFFSILWKLKEKQHEGQGTFSFPMLRAFTNSYKWVIFTFCASNSQLNPWNRKVEEKVRLVLESLGGGTKLGRTFPKPWNRWVRRWCPGCSCPEGPQGSLCEDMPGSSWLQPTHYRTWLWGWAISLCTCLCFSLLKSIWNHKKSYSFFPRRVCFVSDGDWQEIYFSSPWSMTFSILFCPSSCRGGALREQNVGQPEPDKISPPQISLVFLEFSFAFRYSECSLNEEHSIQASTDSSLKQTRNFAL